MSDRETLDKYFILEEGILESIHSENLTDIILKIKISEWNLTKSFFSEWNMPIEHVEARNALERIILGSFLNIVCRNIALFEIDRVKRHGRPDLLLVREPHPQTTDAEDAPKTIFGFGFKDKSLLKENLLKNIVNSLCIWQLIRLTQGLI
jgi:hypothetical protein